MLVLMFEISKVIKSFEEDLATGVSLSLAQLNNKRKEEIKNEKRNNFFIV